MRFFPKVESSLFAHSANIRMNSIQSVPLAPSKPARVKTLKKRNINNENIFKEPKNILRLQCKTDYRLSYLFLSFI